MKINLISESGGQEAIRQHQNRTNAWSSPRNRAFRRDANMGRAMGAIRSGERGVVNPDLVSNNAYHDREIAVNPRTGVFGGTEDNNSIPRSWAGRNPFRPETLSKEISRQKRASEALNSKGTNRRLNIMNPNQPLFKTGATPGYNPSPVRHTQGAFGKAPASATGMRANPPSTSDRPTIEAPYINPAIAPDQPRTAVPKVGPNTSRMGRGRIEAPRINPAIGNKVSDRPTIEAPYINPAIAPDQPRTGLPKVGPNTSPMAGGRMRDAVKPKGTLPPVPTPKGTLPPAPQEAIRRGVSRDAHMRMSKPVNPTDSPIRRVIQRMPNGR